MPRPRSRPSVQAPGVRRPSALVRVLAASSLAAFALAGCGDGEPAGSGPASPTATAAQAGPTTAEPSRPGIRLVISRDGVFREMHEPLARAMGCVGQLHGLLAAGREPEPQQMACLAGTYIGRTHQGRHCTLLLGRAGGPAVRFDRIGSDAVALVAETESTLASHRLSVAPAQPGQWGLQWRRESLAGDGSVETLVLAAAPGADGHDEVRSMTYERARGRRMDVVECHFDA